MALTILKSWRSLTPLAGGGFFSTKLFVTVLSVIRPLKALLQIICKQATAGKQENLSCTRRLQTSAASSVRSCAVRFTN